MSNSAEHSSSKFTQAPLDANSASLKDLTHDEEFWFEDGNVVLIAGKISFKVYRGILAAHSPVFADMFSTADPNVNDQIGNCAVVRLSDSPEDLRHLLRAFIAAKHGFVYSPNPPESFTFDQLSSLTRLAHKYNVDPVLKQSLACLQIHLAGNFHTWVTLGRPFLTKDGCGIGVVSLARLTDTPRMLPVAFYLCAQLGGRMMEGWRREDGTMEHLDCADIQRCIDGYGKLLLEGRSIFAEMLKGGTAKDCSSIWRCQDSFTAAQKIGLDGWAPILHDLGAIVDGWKEQQPESPFCNACKQAMKERGATMQRKLWSRLPTMFNLSIEGWERA